MQEWHDLKVNNINLSLVRFATLGNISFTKTRLDGKRKQGLCLITSLLKNGALTKNKGTNSLAMNKLAKFSSNCFWLRSSLLEGIALAKKFEMFEGVELDLFLEGCFSALRPSFS